MSDTDDLDNEGSFSLLEPFKDKKLRLVITATIIIIIFVFIFISLLSTDSVILLNEPLTNGKDPQFNKKNKSSLNIKPSSSGIELPRKANIPFYKYLISPNTWFNSLNKSSNILREKKESLEFTYNIWIKVFNAEENLDWQQSFETPKILLNRQYSPIILYVPKDNSLRVGMQTDIDTKITFYEINNFFKLQTWQNICLVLEERNLDIFLNGKLKVSYILPSVPYLNTSPIQLFPNYGFYAQVSLITYYNRALNIKEIKNLYKQNKDDKIPYKKNFKNIL